MKTFLFFGIVALLFSTCLSATYVKPGCTNAPTTAPAALPATVTSPDPIIVEPLSPEDQFAADVNASYFQLQEDIKVTTIEALSGNPTSVVFVLHGVGTAVEQITPFVLGLQALGLVNTRFVLPQAPERFVTAYNGTFFSWFDILSLDFSFEPKDQIVFAGSVVSELADEQAALLNIPRSKIAIVGLSQGGAIGFATYFRDIWGTMIGISTALSIRDSYPAELRSGPFGHVQLYHGTNDTTIPIQFARLSRDLIASYGVSVSLAEFEGETHFLSRNETQLAVSLGTATILSQF